jgi:hypothetical protein
MIVMLPSATLAMLKEPWSNDDGGGSMRNRWRAFAAFFLSLSGTWAIADSPAGPPKTDLSRLPRQTAELYRDTTLFPREPKWQRIPWLLDLDEGIRLAKQEKRPLLIWTSGDDPLERC